MKKALVLVALMITGTANAQDYQEDFNRMYSKVLSGLLAEIEVAKQEAERLEAKCAGMSTQPRAMTAQDTARMEKAVKDVLKDPWSARFRNAQKASVWSECRYSRVYEGQVNAKNSYGGYGGFKMFSVDKNAGVYISSY